jgi:hypothetical protein
MQLALSQSPATAHSSSTAHFLGQPAPQSTVGSLPLSTSSSHVGARQRRVCVEHTPLSQSFATLQRSPSPHGLGQPPPQSRSVSS